MMKLNLRMLHLNLKDDEINLYKSKIEQLKKIGDLKSNDAQKIIQSMISM